MKLSTKSTYGLRAMLNIAMNEEGRATSIHDIAEDEGISHDYLVQLLNRLRRSGLVRSVHGPGGGYVLSKERGKISVADIVRTLEGNISPLHCVADRPSRGSCRRNGSCVPKIVWARLAKSINDCLESITLEELCSRSRKKGTYEKRISRQ
jgi:Rrf2 family protein